MSVPRVSVVTPFVSEGVLLAEAIESVRAQDFPDWELILVDDGSCTRSREIAARFAAGDPSRIRVLGPDPLRRGAAAARNRGLRAASAELVAFLDADDVFEPRKLRSEAELLAANPEAALVCSRTRYWHPRRPWADWTERLGVRGERIHRPPSLLLRVLLGKQGDVPCTCGLVARTSAVREVGGFEESLTLYEDQSLLAKLFLAFPTYVSRRCHARYRQHAASTSARARAEGAYDPYGPHPAQEAFFDWLAAYARSHGGDPSVRSEIERARAERRRPPPGRLRILAARVARSLRRS